MNKFYFVEVTGTYSSGGAFLVEASSPAQARKVVKRELVTENAGLWVTRVHGVPNVRNKHRVVFRNTVEE